MFTKNQIDEIRRKLQLTGVKDSSLPEATELTGKESVAIVQNGESKKIGMGNFINSINDWCRGDLLNVSKENQSLSLIEAISSVFSIDRKVGQILTFIDKNTGSWTLYQFRSTINNWYNTDCWVNILDTADYHFRGYFFNEELLKKNYPRPQIGDFAFVGITLESAVTYTCINAGDWYNTKQPSLTFADKFEAIYSEDFNELSSNLDETYADRANKDFNGNIIHDYYATKADIATLLNRIEALETK